MEIIFLWIRDYPPFEENEFTFNGRFNVDFNKDEEAKTIAINITENLSFPQNFFGNTISNISCLIGKNGSGKTSLIDFLKSVKAEQWYSIHDYVQITFDRVRNEFQVRHNLYEKANNRFPNRIYAGEESYDINCNLPDGFGFATKGYYKESQIVYFTPFLDLKYFPKRFDTKPYVDVSTDFLILTDKDSSSKDNPDVLEIHRFKNIERQFEFVHRFQENHAVNYIIAIPEGIEVYSLEQRTDRNWGYNLSYSAKEVRAYFIGDGTPERKGVIYDRLYDLGGIIYQLNQEGRADSDEHRALEFEKRRWFFLEGFIHHYFDAWNSNNHWLDLNIGIGLYEFEGMDPWDACRQFIIREPWTRDNGATALEFLNMIDELLTTDNSKVSFSTDNRRIQTNNQTLVLNILRTQVNYLKTLPSNSGAFKSYDVIQIDWRNLSSGEKAYLDIFSRLNYAYTELKNREVDKYTQKVTPTEWLYLFIDEGEVGFHPEWQKNYIDLLHKMVPIIFTDLTIQIILTSHSPFIASDIPLQNIIFLDKIEGKVIVNKELNFQNTFAANIHTLLADGFFLNNGLIGDFAKKKIQTVIDWINNDEADLTLGDEMKKVLGLIGEPIVRNKLIDEFNRKLGIDDEIDKIDNEMMRLQLLKDELLKKRDDAEPQD